MTRKPERHNRGTVLFGTLLTIIVLVGCSVNAPGQDTRNRATAVARSQQTGVSKYAYPRRTPRQDPSRTAVAVQNPCTQAEESPACLKFRLDYIATRLDGLENRLNALSEGTRRPSINSLDTRLKSVETELTKLLRRVTRPGSDGKADSVDDIWTEISNIKRKLRMN